MVHELHLHDQPFRKIAEGRKTLEVRLRDEKRRALGVGDTLRIINRTNGSVLLADIGALIPAGSFTRLLEELTPQAQGSDTLEKALAELYEYYDPLQEDALGVLGIVMHDVRRQ